jgi:LuxR family transcriptional regulator, maltose regulon positive regulatory protein
MAAHVANQASTGGRRPAMTVGNLILASKITAPNVPGWAVERPQLIKLIAEGARCCPLTVVTGPPGAGKTMTLASWAATEPGMVAWLCVDEFDNRPGVFWSYAVAALRRCGVAIPKALLADPQAADDGEFLLRLTAALATQDAPVTLVLDDLQLLVKPKVLRGLEFMLRNAGPRLHLVVASRMDPLLPLHRYRLAGQLTEVRTSDLAFSIDEAGQLLAQHGAMLTADSLESLTKRTEGWAAGLRLAAISLSAHPDPSQFVKQLIAEDGALIGYLVDEALNVQPPEVRDVLLSTSILGQVSANAAVYLTGNEQAAGIFMALVRTNAFVQPIGSGWYRYHTLFAEMLRLKLRHQDPDRVAALHHRAARWYERNGLLSDAVRHASRAGDWRLAADLVIDQLAIGQIMDSQGGHCLAEEFASMPPAHAWTEPQPFLISAAIALAAGRGEACTAALDAADNLLERCPADQEAAGRLTVAVIRLTACLRTGDLTAATAAVSRAELMLSRLRRSKLAQHPDVSRRVLSGRAAIELWSGQLDEAARVLEAGLAGAVSGGESGWIGQLALVEAIRGRLSCAAALAGQAVRLAGEHRPPDRNPSPAPLVALAWVHLQRNELRETRGWIKQADAALSVGPDKLIGVVAYLVAAGGALAEGRAAVATQIIARARSGWPVPAWLDQQLSLVESRACAAVADIQAALVAAERADGGNSPEAAVTLAHAWASAGDGDSAQYALAPVLAADSGASDRVRLQAWLVDAWLSYTSGDRARGRRSLAAALRLAEPEQLRLPFAAERGWLGPVLRRDPELAATHRRLLAPALGHEQIPALVRDPDRAPVLVLEPLTERELEVLVHVSGILNTAEVANEMYISVNTVKTHLRNIYRKLAAAHRGEAVRRARQLQLI